MEYSSWILSFLLAIGYGIYYYCFQGLNHFKKHGIRHITPWPIVGNMGPMFLRQSTLADLVNKIYNLSPNAKYVGFFDMMNPVVVIRDPEIIKSIAVKNFDMFPNHRSFIDEITDPLFGKNLFSLRDDKWRDIRNLLSPAFTSSKMKMMFKLMSDCASDFVDFLAKVPESKNVMEMKDCCTKYTNDVIATCAFGINVNSMKNPTNEFYVNGFEATNFDSIRTVQFFLARSMPYLSKILGIQIVSNRVAKFFKNLVRDTIQIRDTQNIVRPDMMQLMMDSRGKKGPGWELTIEDMTSQAFIFFFGGFDTVSILMCFAIYELAVNSDIQEKLREEVDAAIKATKGTLTYEAVNGMQYLDAVINEAMRMYPPGIFLDRICSKDFELPPALPGDKPHILKEGAGVWFPAYGFHRDPKYFKDPETFKPERFLDENKTEIDLNAYMPFGLGPRMCIGNRFALLETKVMLVHLLARCELKRCEKTVYPVRLDKTSFILKAEGGFWVKIQPRKDSPYVSSDLVNGSTSNGSV